MTDPNNNDHEKKPDQPLDKDIEAMTFEKALTELQDIVAGIEEGDIALKDAVKQYERAMQLYQKCTKELASAKLKVEQIMLDSGKKIIGKKDFPLDDQEQ